MIERSKMKETFPDWYYLIWLNGQRWRKRFLIDITSYDWTVKDESNVSWLISFIFDRSIIWGYINQETFPSSLTVQSYQVISIRKRFLDLWPFNHMRLYQSGKDEEKVFPDWYNLIWLNGQRWRKCFLIDITSYDWTVKDEGNVSWLILPHIRSIIWGYINQETFPSSLTVQSYEVISIRKHFLLLWPFNHMRSHQSGNITFIFDRSIIWGYIKEMFPDWYNLIWLNGQRWRKCFSWLI
jgi:predicted DNA-binding transcriptional regulator AlpA